jgi:hypothetical protein
MNQTIAQLEKRFEDIEKTLMSIYKDTRPLCMLYEELSNSFG